MATLSPAELFVRENRLYSRTNVVLAVCILAGFAIFAVLARIDPREMPLIVHLHAAVMVSWLGLFMAQSLLGAGRNIDLHRRLGWVAAGLAFVVVGSGWAVGFAVTTGGRGAPVFDPGYFLALTLVGPTIFAIMVASAIARRKQTDWHRRLMLGSLVVILEPLLGRLSLIGFMIAKGGPDATIAYLAQRQWLLPLVEFIIHGSVVAILMMRDRSLRGSVHPAMWWIAVAVTALYAGTTALGLSQPFADWTRSLMPPSV